MKKTVKKTTLKRKAPVKVVKAVQSAPKTKKVAKIVESLVANTRGAQMPNPDARHRHLRKDARFAFRN